MTWWSLGLIQSNVVWSRYFLAVTVHRPHLSSSSLSPRNLLVPGQLVPSLEASPRCLSLCRAHPGAWLPSARPYPLLRRQQQHLFIFSLLCHAPCCTLLCSSLHRSKQAAAPSILFPPLREQSSKQRCIFSMLSLPIWFSLHRAKQIRAEQAAAASQAHPSFSDILSLSVTLCSLSLPAHSRTHTTQH